MIQARQQCHMVAVAQLVEHQIVVLGVAGSSPVSHPEGLRPVNRLDCGGAAKLPVAEFRVLPS